MYLFDQKLKTVMNKSKLMRYELVVTLMDSFQLTVRNLLSAYSIQFSWDLRIGE